MIKLFGRVEDNDPAGAKGAESSVVTVRIVSQEEFERMVRTRQGIEAMLSKYYAAQRRMEAAGQADGRPAEEAEEAAGRREAIGGDPPRTRTARRS